MKHFAKTMVAAALLVGAGSANAAIEKNGGGLNEAYLSAYDITTGKTFTLDTGVTYNDLVANVSNTNYSLNFDLSALTNWTSFITGANTSKIKYAVAVGNSVDFGAAITGNAPLAVTQSILFGIDVSSGIENHAIDINSRVANVTSQNLSTLALDSDSAGTGQHANAASVWGTWIQDPQANYGDAVGFQLGVLDQNTGDNIASTFVGQWKLAGNSLTFTAPPVASVPLPAAVWMFGAGLMGVLRLNRRKSLAV